MLSSDEFIHQSLELHLFFARIMKEHAFFLEAGFTPKNSNLTEHADTLRMEFDVLLEEAISLSYDVISPEVLKSGEIVTPYTQKAEMVSSYLTGIQIPGELTQSEAGLISGNTIVPGRALERKVLELNTRAIDLIMELIDFKAKLLADVLACRVFTVNYPLLIDHILREAQLYLRMIKRIQARDNVNIKDEIIEQEIFWNRIMAEHSKFIRGLLDPTENDLFIMANNFGNEFDKLTAQAIAAMDMTLPVINVTEESLNATQRIHDFKKQGTEGLLNCKIKSIIIPLLGDHVLREANHYLRLLKSFDKL